LIELGTSLKCLGIIKLARLIFSAVNDDLKFELLHFNKSFKKKAVSVQLIINC